MTVRDLVVDGDSRSSRYDISKEEALEVVDLLDSKLWDAPRRTDYVSTGLLMNLVINRKSDSRIYSRLGSVDPTFFEIHLRLHISTLKLKAWRDYLNQGMAERGKNGA